MHPAVKVIALYEVAEPGGLTEIVTDAGVNKDYPAGDFALAHLSIVQQQRPGCRVELVGCFTRNFAGAAWKLVPVET